MKIQYICPYLPCSGINAGRNRMFEIIKRLAVRNEVSVISFVDKEDRENVGRLKEICRKVDVIERTYAWRPDPLSRLPAMINEFSSAAMRELIKERLHEEDFDILHFEYLIMAQYMPDRYKAAKFLTEHELHFLSQLKEVGLEKGILNKIRTLGSAFKKKIYEVSICGRFDSVITMTEGEAEVLNSYCRTLNISSLAMGVDQKAFYPTDNGTKEDIDILFVGFFGHRPNVDAVDYFYREIFPLVRNVKHDARFTVIGVNPPDSILSLERDRSVRVLGRVDNLSDYLARAKVFIMPIRLGLGMRGKLFEAWAMSKPVVSTSLGCRGVTAENGKNIIIADEPSDFAKNIVMLLDDREKRRYLGKNARLLVEERYNWDILTTKLEEMYKKEMRLKLGLKG